MAPSRLKLTMTVMSIGLACDGGGGFQQDCSLRKDVLDGVDLLRLGLRGAPTQASSSSRGKPEQAGLRRAVAMALT